jgi:hypothetical protein
MSSLLRAALRLWIAGDFLRLPGRSSLTRNEKITLLPSHSRVNAMVAKVKGHIDTLPERLANNKAKTQSQSGR